MPQTPSPATEVIEDEEEEEYIPTFLEEIMIDEFASTLDRTTARCVCRALRRWVMRCGALKHGEHGEHRGGRADRIGVRNRFEEPEVRVVVASAHDDIAAWLEPELIAVARLGGGAAELSDCGLGIAACQSASPIRDSLSPIRNQRPRFPICNGEVA